MKLRMFVPMVMLAVLAVAFALPAATVKAWDGWCWDDPIVEINGTEVSIEIRIQEENLSALLPGDSIKVDVFVPKGVSASVVAEDVLRYPDGSPVLVKGQQVTTDTNIQTTARSADTVDIRVQVPNRGPAFPVKVGITVGSGPLEIVTGTSHSPVVATIPVP